MDKYSRNASSPKIPRIRILIIGNGCILFLTAELFKLLVPLSSVTRKKYQEKIPSSREHAPYEELCLRMGLHHMRSSKKRKKILSADMNAPRKDCLASASSTFESILPSIRGVISCLLFSLPVHVHSRLKWGAQTLSSRYRQQSLRSWWLRVLATLEEM